MLPARGAIGQPCARHPLRLGNPGGGHFPRQFGPAVPRFLMPHHRGEVEPFMRSDKVVLDIPAGRIANAQYEERIGVFLLFAGFRPAVFLKATLNHVRVPTNLIRY